MKARWLKLWFKFVYTTDKKDKLWKTRGQQNKKDWQKQEIYYRQTIKRDSIDKIKVTSKANRIEETSKAVTTGKNGEYRLNKQEM